MSQRGKPTFFATPEDLRAWLAKHHEHRAELVIGFWKIASGKPSVTWPQAIEEAVASRLRLPVYEAHPTKELNSLELRVES